MIDTSFPKEKIKIVLLEGVHSNSVDNLKAAGYNNVVRYEKAFPENELIPLIADAHLIGIRSKTQITANILENTPRLLGIGCFCIGTNQVDLKRATDLGIAVFNSPYSNTRSVAELVIGEMIMLLRRIPERNNLAHQGGWLKTAEKSYEMRGKTLGIVGYGRIGSQLSILAEAMGMHVLYYDIATKLPLGNARSVSSLDELLAKSQVVSLHVPETPETVNMIGAKEIAAMQKDSYLLNLSRGTVVDIDALAQALHTKHLAGAAIDVFPHEPESAQQPFKSVLQDLPNVILTPHIGGSTLEAQENIGIDASTKLINFLEKGETTACHTIPEINLPPQGSHRVLHFHTNTAGVLSALNKVFSKYKLNIDRQYLQTKGSYGYVVTDVDKNISKEAEEKLREVKHTVRMRIVY
ncbi:MAG: phosphoglycerate dehydrogenase [Chitinophagales bacterium]|nr:phosphoglycerate dehydrogenase [Bacteroidota bacterium]MCB9043943.1 phosphoglycerate dehydrogenase [Chitinophagales bacterium]